MNAMTPSATRTSAAMTMPSFPVWPPVPDEVTDAVTDALHIAHSDPAWLGALDGCGVVGEFETEFARFVGIRHALALNSGASALHLALLAAGVGPGDEVILSAYGWGQVLVFIDALDAVPVFADISLDNLGLDPASVAAKLTPRTRAIIVTHFAGLPADVESLLPMAETVGATVIEDCAGALGARWVEHAVGTIGHIGVFSFGSRKHLPCGEGGALVTGDEGIWQRAIVAGQHPDRSALQVSDPRLHPTECFWPYRMHPLAAVMGRALLPFLPRWADERNTNHRDLCNGLLSQLVHPVTASSKDECAWGGLALTWRGEASARMHFVQQLQERGVPISCGPVGVPLHRRPEIVRRWGIQAACANAEARCDGQELYLRQTIALIGEQKELVANLAGFLAGR